MTRLTWLTAPVAQAFVGETLPEFSVQSDPGVTEVLHLISQGNQAKEKLRFSFNH